ncbi:hypothetical protein HanRHA438_Chr01g0023251 [Helianthus annuus]|nr:hypothetical protein HanRHA438_Chr01g0023251 [Helianthus annuus]
MQILHTLCFAFQFFLRNPSIISFFLLTTHIHGFLHHKVQTNTILNNRFMIKIIIIINLNITIINLNIIITIIIFILNIITIIILNIITAISIFISTTMTFS